MTDLLSIVLLIIAFITLMVTFLIVTKLYRAKTPQLPTIERGERGDPLRLHWPVVDWLLEREGKLPGYYYPIGVMYGIFAGATACILLLLAYYVASILGLIISYIGASYSYEGISQALKRKAFPRASIAALGLILGWSVFFLHIAALVGRRLLPAWSL